MSVPSGEQFEISFEDQRLVVVAVGGGIRSYCKGHRQLLDGFARDEMCDGARGQPLIPWPNRIEDGSYAWDGGAQQLPLSEPDRHNAIHGLMRWSNWKATEHSEARVMVEHALFPQPGYPFTLHATIEYALSAFGLYVRTSVKNAGTQACPFAMGQHPYISVGSPKIDADLLRLPARTYLPTDARGLPIGQKPVAGSRYDFRSPRKIGETDIDVAFTDLERDSERRAWVELCNSDGTLTTSLWLDSNYPFLEIFTGDTLQVRPRQGLGVEPMTAAPNAFRTGNGLRRLDPGEGIEACWGIVPDKPPRESLSRHL